MVGYVVYEREAKRLHKSFRELRHAKSWVTFTTHNRGEFTETAVRQDHRDDLVPAWDKGVYRILEVTLL